MKALIFLLKTTIINYFKRLIQKPQKAIGPVLVILFFMSIMTSSKKSVSDNIEPYYFVGIFVLVTIIMFLYSLYSGTKKVNFKFGMCDVNLIFVSPIRPQTVIIYGIIKMIAVELLASLYLLYYVPNLLRKFNVSTTNQIMFCLVFIIFQLILCNIIKLFIFVLNTKYKCIGGVIRSTIKAIIGFVVLGVIGLIIQGNAIEFAKIILKNVTNISWVRHIPVFGWMREIARQTINGINLSYGIYIVLILLISVLLLYITYNMELDFYEDMLSLAENNDFIKNVRSGKESAVNSNGKKSFFQKAFKETKLKLNGVYEAKVLFSKHMNEYLKRSLIFFLNTYSIVLLTVSICLGIFDNGLEIKIVFLASLVLLFFTAGMGGKIYNEIYNSFIFLMPDTPQRKLFYGIASSLVKITFDGIILFVPFGILSKASVLEIILCILCYFALGGMLSYSGLFAFRISEILGFKGEILQAILFMIFQLLLMVPAAVIAIITTTNFTTLTGYAIYLAYLCFSLIGAVLFSFGCVGIFNDMEFRN